MVRETGVLLGEVVSLEERIEDWLSHEMLGKHFDGVVFADCWIEHCAQAAEKLIEAIAVVAVCAI